MDSFGFHNHVKMEKANAMLRYRRLQRITAMFRLVELCVFLIILSRFTTQLPVAFKLSGEYFRGLSFTAVSPRFVFIIGNAIVIVLFLKSSQLSVKDGETSNNKADFYDEYVKNCERNRDVSIQEIKKHRKQSNSAFAEVDSDIAYSVIKEKKMYRSHSENLKKLHHGETGRQLRRSVTETRQKSVDFMVRKRNQQRLVHMQRDEMSNEEFRRTVEAFIARQQRALREEEFAATLSLET